MNNNSEMTSRSADSLFDIYQNLPQPKAVEECIIEIKLLTARQSTVTNKLSQLMDVHSDQHEDFNNVDCAASALDCATSSTANLLTVPSTASHLEKVAGENEADKAVNDTTSKDMGRLTMVAGNTQFWRLDSSAKMKKIAMDLSKDLETEGEIGYDEESAPLVVALRKLQDKNIQKTGIKSWTVSLADLFYKTDVDKSGTIQPAEYRKMIEKIDVSESMKNALADKFTEIDVNEDGIIHLYEFLYFFLRFQKFNEELLLNSQNNAPYLHEKDLSICQSLRLGIYTFIECPNRNRASKALFCLDLMLTSVPVAMLFWQAIFPSHKLNWGHDTYLWVLSIFYAIQYVLGLLTCRSTRIFILDLTHAADLLSFVFWIGYNTLLPRGFVDAAGFVVFRVVRTAKINNVFSFKALEQNLAVYTDTLQLAYTGYSVVLGFLSMLTLFLSIIFYAFERGNYNEEEGMWIRDPEEGESPFSNLFNCIYFTIATFTTLGYGRLTPMSYVGRIVAIVAVITGLVNLTFVISIIGACFQEVFRVYVKNRSTKMEEARSTYIEEQIKRANVNVKERRKRRSARRNRGETELMLNRR